MYIENDYKETYITTNLHIVLLYKIGKDLRIRRAESVTDLKFFIEVV